MDHISATIQEVMESYEVVLHGKTHPVKALSSLSGHNILRYKIHGDKQVPFVKTRTSQRMEEGDVFAIETFGSTGKGRARDDAGVYGYARNENVSTAGVHLASAKSLLKSIDENFGTLPFSRNYLERVGVKNYHLGMRSLIANGIVECYAPLVDIPGSYVAQFEHVSGLFRNHCLTQQHADSLFLCVHRQFCSGLIVRKSSVVVLITRDDDPWARSEEWPTSNFFVRTCPICSNRR